MHMKYLIYADGITELSIYNLRGEREQLLSPCLFKST